MVIQEADQDLPRSLSGCESVQWYNLSGKIVTLVLAISPGELAEKNQTLTGAV